MNFKAKAEQGERRIINQMQANETRQMVRVRLPAADMRRAVRGLESRAEWLDLRREPDPVVREIARLEARHCRRIAGHIIESVRGAA